MRRGGFFLPDNFPELDTRGLVLLPIHHGRFTFLRAFTARLCIPATELKDFICRRLVTRRILLSLIKGCASRERLESIYNLCICSRKYPYTPILH